jgi:hypothetical protein
MRASKKSALSFGSVIERPTRRRPWNMSRGCCTVDMFRGSYAKSEPGEGTGLSSPSREFLRHDSGVRGWESKRPLNGKPLRGSCASARGRSGYSSPSCVPAELGSASPDIPIVPKSAKTRRRTVDTFRGNIYGSRALVQLKRFRGWDVDPGSNLGRSQAAIRFPGPFDGKQTPAPWFSARSQRRA